MIFYEILYNFNKFLNKNFKLELCTFYKIIFTFAPNEVLFASNNPFPKIGIAFGPPKFQLNFNKRKYLIKTTAAANVNDANKNIKIIIFVTFFFLQFPYAFFTLRNFTID
jgi:hypothetical protein